MVWFTISSAQLSYIIGISFIFLRFNLDLFILTSDTYLLHPKKGKVENKIETIHMKNTILFAYKIRIRIRFVGEY